MRLNLEGSILNRQINNLETESKKSEYESNLYQKCSEIFKKWLEDSIEHNVGSIADLVSSGLQHIIYDQDLEFKIKQEMKYNRVAMRFILEQDGVEGDPLLSYGGGTAVVASLILRLAVMTRMNMGNLLILDESMVALANVYVPQAAMFIRQLSEKTGVNILMVTHNSEFINHAHSVYEGRKDLSLKLTKLKV